MKTTNEVLIELEDFIQTEWPLSPWPDSYGNAIYQILDKIKQLKTVELDSSEPHDDGYYGGVANCSLDCGCNEEGC